MMTEVGIGTYKEFLEKKLKRRILLNTATGINIISIVGAGHIIKKKMDVIMMIEVKYIIPEKMNSTMTTGAKCIILEKTRVIEEMTHLITRIITADENPSLIEVIVIKNFTVKIVIESMTFSIEIRGFVGRIIIGIMIFINEMIIIGIVVFVSEAIVIEIGTEGVRKEEEGETALGREMIITEGRAGFGKCRRPALLFFLEIILKWDRIEKKVYKVFKVLKVCKIKII